MKLRHPVARLNGTADRKAPPKERMVRTRLGQKVRNLGVYRSQDSKHTKRYDYYSY